MTERLYLSDAYLTTFNARVVDRLHLPPDARLAIILDRTVFSPNVAGVASDRGVLNDVQVTDVFEDEKGNLLHILPQDTWRDDVQGRLDWPRRFDLMQHHTAQHILSEALSQVGGAETVAVSISPQAAWIEVNKLLPDADVERAETWANQVIVSGRAVRTAMVDPARLAALPKPLSGQINHQSARVFSIEGLRVSVCPAAHVARTSELGLVQVVRTERTGDRLRVEFQCGARVTGELYRRSQLVNRLASLLNSPPNELEQAVINVQTQAKQAVDAVIGLHDKVLEYEAVALVATAERMGDLRVVNRVFLDRDVAETKRLTRMLSEQPGLVVLIGTAGARAQLFFGCSPDVDHDMNVLMRAAAPVIGTQGRGQPHWAESMLVQADAARVEQALSKSYKLLQAKR